MNLFILDVDPRAAARMQCDKHVVKMTLETAQILSTINGGPYKPTHNNHPIVKWAGQYRTNYDWTWRHGLALAHEYTHRFGRQHKCEDIIGALMEPLIDIPLGQSAFVQCMPEAFQGHDPVEAYRNYYISKDIPWVWTNRDPPEWFLEIPAGQERKSAIIARIN